MGCVCAVDGSLWQPVSLSETPDACFQRTRGSRLPLQVVLVVVVVVLVLVLVVVVVVAAAAAAAVVLATSMMI